MHDKTSKKAMDTVMNKNTSDNGTTTSRHETLLLQEASSWIRELQSIRDEMEMASVRNAITLNFLYMTGAVEEENLPENGIRPTS